mmetsp:Transcript_6409/g.17896  ORF Transcript_6409/g.17896 Transcript_6409/m.17896 type:complete len:423 (-) Transcript_6409:1394-2662(-)
MGGKKLFRGGGGGTNSSGRGVRVPANANEHEAASLGITSVDCTNAGYSDLVSPMKGPSFGAASGTSGAKTTGRGKAGWPAGIRKRIVVTKKKKKKGSPSESLGTPASDSPKNNAGDVSSAKDPVNAVGATTANVSGRSVKFADEGSIVAPLHTTKLIDSTSSTNNETDIVGRRARAKSVQPSPGEGYIGFPPTTAAEAEQYWRRVLVMLLSPETQEFEIVAIHYDTRERTGLSNIMHQIPKVATSKCFSGQARSRMRYRGLTRVQKRFDPTSRCSGDTSFGRGSPEPGEELISVLSLADYDIQPDEMLVAIPKGFEGKVIAPMAASLLADGRVQRLVNRIVRSNRLPPPPTLCGRFQKAFVRSKRRLKRQAGNGGIGIMLTGGVLAVLILLMWMHIFAPTYLPTEIQELGAAFGRTIEAFWE